MKSGFISIIGKANAGKSTLLNRVLGEKIAAVSKRPQTTRTRITGVLTDEESQMIFIDTPGLHRPKNKLGTFMQRQAAEGASDGDITLYMVDSSLGLRFLEEDTEYLTGTVRSETVFLILNKVDLVPKENLLELIDKYSKILDFAEILPISAQTGDGVKMLLDCIRRYLPEGPQYFASDTLTDQPERQICAEMIREKLMRNLGDEIPYGIAVAIEKMHYDEEKNLTSISATIYCEREGHKPIIIGKKGEMLKRIGSDARKEMERFLQGKVFLECWVKIKENWRNSEMQLKNFGYTDE